MNPNLVDDALDTIREAPVTDLPELGAVYTRARTRTRNRRVAVGAASLACLGLIVGSVVATVNRDDTRNVVAQQPTASASSTSQPSDTSSTKPAPTPSTSGGLKRAGTITIGNEMVDPEVVSAGDLMFRFFPGSLSNEAKPVTVAAYQVSTGKRAWSVKEDNVQAASAGTGAAANTAVVAYLNSLPDSSDPASNEDTGSEVVLRRAADGKEIRRIPTASRTLEAPNSTVIGDSTVITVAPASLTAYDIATGQQKWKTPLSSLTQVPQGNVFQQVLVDGDALTALVASPSGEHGQYLYRFALADGRALSGAEIRTTKQENGASATSLEHLIGEYALLQWVNFANGENRAYNLELVKVADGSSVRKFPAYPSGGIAVLDSANNVLVHESGNDIRAYHIPDGRQLWARKNTAYQAAFGVHDGYTYLVADQGKNQKLVTLRTTTGKEVKSLPIGDIEGGGVLYAGGSGLIFDTDKGMHFFAYQK